MIENRNDSLMRKSHLPSSHLWQLFPDLKQVLQNVRTQLKLFTNVRSTIWGVMHIFLVELQESDVFQTFWVVDFFRTWSDSSCIPSKTRHTTKTQWKSWALVAPSASCRSIVCHIILYPLWSEVVQNEVFSSLFDLL